MAIKIPVEANETSLARSINRGVNLYNRKSAGKNSLDLKINERSFSQPLGRITSDLNDFESALKASNARVLAFGASTALIGGVAKAFKDVAVATIEVEKAITDINRVLEVSGASISQFSSSLFEISKNTAVTFAQAAEAATEFSRQGLGVEETLKRTEDALILVRLAGVSSTKAVEDLTAAVNGFSKESLTSSQILNKVVAVEQAFAVSAKDLTEALSRTGQAAQEAGVSFDQLNALVSAAQEQTARGGAVIGNALKTIFTRLQRSETLDSLQEFNIAVRDVEGNLLPAVQVLKNFASAYKTLNQETRAYLSEQIAGVFQVNILKGVVNDLNSAQSNYNKALTIGSNATNEANIANEKLNQTLSALFSQAGVGIQQLGANIGQVTFEPLFRSLLQEFNGITTFINEQIEGEGIGSNIANGLLKGFRNVLSGPALLGAISILAKISVNALKDFQKIIPTLSLRKSETQKTKEIEQSIFSILQSQNIEAKALLGYEGNKKAQAELILKATKAQTAEYQKQQRIARDLSKLLVNQVTVGPRGLEAISGSRQKNKALGFIPSPVVQAEKAELSLGVIFLEVLSNLLSGE